MSISDTLQKIKAGTESFLRGDIFIVFIVIVVGFASFGLGRLSKDAVSSGYMSEGAGNVPMEAGERMRVSGGAAISSADVGQNGEVVASKNSDKYHYPWCSGAERIKEENQVWFASTDEARVAGHVPAGNCKGLE